MTDRNGSIPFPKLIRRAAEGDEGAWAELHAQFGLWMYAVISRMPGARRVLHANSVDPDDVVQEAWTRLIQDDFRSLRGLRDLSPEGFRRYVGKMIRNILRDLDRRAGAERRPKFSRADTEDEHDRWVYDHPNGAPDPEQALVQKEDLQRWEASLWDRWAGDPGCARNVLICLLHSREGKSAVWIAEHLHLEITNKGVEKVIAKGKGIRRDPLDGPGTPARRSGGGGSDQPEEPEHWQSEEELVDFLDGEVDRATHQARIEHMARCEQCRQRFVRRADELDAPLSDHEMAQHRALARPEQLNQVLAAVAAERQRQPRGWIARLRGARLGGASSRPGWLLPAGLATAVVVAALVAVVLFPRGGRELPGADDPIVALETARRDAGALVPDTIDGLLRSGQTLRPEPPGPTRDGRGTDDADPRFDAIERRLIDQLAAVPKPRQADVCNALGYLKLARKRLELAEGWYHKALRVREDDAEARIGLALVSQQRAQQAPNPASRHSLLSQAVHHLELVREPTPLRARALYNRVCILLELRDLDRAEQLLGEYEKIDPESGWTSALRLAMQDARKK